jgi:hypothetical protein
MRPQILGRNADIASIETKDELDDLGSESPGAGGILVPQWANYISRIYATGAFDGAAVGSLVMFGRLEGGIRNGDNEITFMIAGGGWQVITGTQQAMGVWQSPPLAVPVQSGARMKLYAETFGDGESDAECLILVQFSDSAPPEGAKWTRSYTADVDSVDTATALTGALGQDSNPNTQVPSGAQKLGWVSGAFGYDQAADGTAVMFIRLKAGPVEDEQIVPVGAEGTIAGQAGSDETALLVPAQNVHLDAPASALADLAGKVQGELAGDDIGSGQIGATLWFA